MDFLVDLFNQYKNIFILGIITKQIEINMIKILIWKLTVNF